MKRTQDIPQYSNPLDLARKGLLLISTSVNTYKILYIVIASVIFAVTLLQNYHASHSDYFTIPEIKTSFQKVFIFSAVFILYLAAVKRLCIPLVTTVSIFLGMLLRVTYTLFTDSGTRTYDVYRDQWGHLDYIQYIASHFSLPPVNECQAYHPPVHHIISACVLNLSKHWTQKEFLQLKFIQLTMVLISCLTLILFMKILKELHCSNLAVLMGVSFFAFHPTNIYFSSRINNDNTTLLFYTLSIYLLLKWMRNNALRNIILLALTAALAVLTKLSGILLLPVIALAFAAEFFKHPEKRLMLFKQYTLFGILYFPLGMSYQLRNYVLFHQKFGYVPSMGRGFTPTLGNLLGIPVDNFIKSPFNHGGLTGGEYFMEFFIKSSLFGEWQYPGSEKKAYWLLILTAAIILIIGIYILIANKNMLYRYQYIFLLNIIVPIALAMKFRMDLPIACSQDFRYAAPILLSASLFLGNAAEWLKQTKHRALKYLVISCIASFCMLSISFVLGLDQY